jgi:predicted Fe-Mo cluster-binding NifX family protein
MKVAFPTNKGEKIAKHSSFCTSFLVIDTRTQERVTIANPLRAAGRSVKADAGNPSGRQMGTGRIVSALLAEAGVEFYVCCEAGEKFTERLQSAGIAVHTTPERQIELALNDIAETERPHTNGRKGFGKRRGRGAGREVGNTQAEAQGGGFGRRRSMHQGEGRGMRRGLGRGMQKRRCGIAD